MDAQEIYHSFEDVEEAREHKREQVAQQLWALIVGDSRYRGPFQSFQFIADGQLKEGAKAYWRLTTSIPSTLDLEIRVYSENFFIVHRNNDWLKYRSREEVEKLIENPLQ